MRILLFVVGVFTGNILTLAAEGVLIWWLTSEVKKKAKEAAIKKINDFGRADNHQIVNNPNVDLYSNDNIVFNYNQRYLV